MNIQAFVWLWRGTVVLGWRIQSPVFTSTIVQWQGWLALLTFFNKTGVKSLISCFSVKTSYYYNTFNLALSQPKFTKFFLSIFFPKVLCRSARLLIPTWTNWQEGNAPPRIQQQTMVVGFGSALRGNVWIWRRVAKATTGGLRVCNVMCMWMWGRESFIERSVQYDSVRTFRLPPPLEACWRDSCHPASHPSQARWCNSAVAETNWSDQGWAGRWEAASERRRVQPTLWDTPGSMGWLSSDSVTQSLWTQLTRSLTGSVSHFEIICQTHWIGTEVLLLIVNSVVIWGLKEL